MEKYKVSLTVVKKITRIVIADTWVQAIIVAKKAVQKKGAIVERDFINDATKVERYKPQPNAPK